MRLWPSTRTSLPARRLPFPSAMTLPLALASPGQPGWAQPGPCAARTRPLFNTLRANPALPAGPGARQALPMGHALPPLPTSAGRVAGRKHDDSLSAGGRMVFISSLSSQLWLKRSLPVAHGVGIGEAYQRALDAASLHARGP